MDGQMRDKGQMNELHVREMNELHVREMNELHVRERHCINEISYRWYAGLRKAGKKQLKDLHLIARRSHWNMTYSVSPAEESNSSSTQYCWEWYRPTLACVINSRLTRSIRKIIIKLTVLPDQKVLYKANAAHLQIQQWGKISNHALQRISSIIQKAFNIIFYLKLL